MAADEQLHSNVDYTGDCGVDTSFCSDDFDFEKLSIPCSESASGDEAIVDTTNDEHMLKTADMSETARVVPMSYEVRKPPVMSAHDEVRLQLPSTAVGRVGRSSVCTDLLDIAKNIDESMAADVEAEVEKRMRLERAEHERQISHLEAQLMAKAEKLDSGRYHNRHGEQQSEYSALREENERLTLRCAKLEQQMYMLQHQASAANRQMKEYEDELHALRAKFSADRVQPPQQHRPTFEIVKHVNPIQQISSTSHTLSQTKWSCPRCTYHNTSSVNECEMCELPRRLDKPLKPYF